MSFSEAGDGAQRRQIGPADPGSLAAPGSIGRACGPLPTARAGDASDQSSMPQVRGSQNTRSGQIMQIATPIICRVTNGMIPR